MLFTDVELKQLCEKAQQDIVVPDDVVCDTVNVLWEDGESSCLFSGGSEFWELYPTVN